MREAILWTGHGLVRRGLLETPDDVLHLSLAELKEIAGGGGPADLRTLVKEREEEFHSRSGLRPPATLGHGGPPPPDVRRALYDLPPNVGVDGLLLRGVGASPGKVTGRARVVAMSPVPPQVEQGDILVTPNAGPCMDAHLPDAGGPGLGYGGRFPTRGVSGAGVRHSRGHHDPRRYDCSSERTDHCPGCRAGYC